MTRGARHCSRPRPTRRFLRPTSRCRWTRALARWTSRRATPRARRHCSSWKYLSSGRRTTKAAYTARRRADTRSTGHPLGVRLFCGRRRVVCGRPWVDAVQRVERLPSAERVFAEHDVGIFHATKCLLTIKHD